MLGEMRRLNRAERVSLACESASNCPSALTTNRSQSRLPVDHLASRRGWCQETSSLSRPPEDCAFESRKVGNTAIGCFQAGVMLL